MGFNFSYSIEQAANLKFVVSLVIWQTLLILRIKLIKHCSCLMTRLNLNEAGSSVAANKSQSYPSTEFSEMEIFYL